MRKLIGFLVAVAVILGGLAIVDVWVRHRVQHLVAAHVQAELPGSAAVVKISSFPFIGRLAVSGNVPEMDVEVDHASAGGLEFSSIDVVAHNLKVNTGKLTSGKVVLEGIGSGSVTGDVTEASIDRLAGVSLDLGSGTVEVAGVTVTPQVAISDGTIEVSAPNMPAVRIPVPATALLPCAETATIVPGALQLSCQLTQLPPALAHYTASL